VADKSFAVSATKMNVLYANDIPNPIKVSVAGYQPEDIKVSFNGGFLDPVNKKKGEYIVKPSQANVGKEVNVSLSVKKKDGKTKSIGTSVFRVKPIPPQRVTARFADGTYDKQKISENSFGSKIPGFDFPIKFYVQEFTVVCQGTQKSVVKVKGNKVSKEAAEEINKLTKNQSVLFKDFVIKQDGKKDYINRDNTTKFYLLIK
jgi:hypothetical protein